MGEHVKEVQLFSYRVDLEERIRHDHPLRRVAQWVDFIFVRQEVEPCYGRNGNVSVDPVVIFKLIFLLFWDKIRPQSTIPQTVDDCGPKLAVLVEAINHYQR